MPIIPIKVKMYGGVSRQAPDVRHTNQCQDAQDCLLTIKDGYLKRAGSSLVKGQTWSSGWSNTARGELDVATPTGDKVYHWYERDNEERFLMVFGDDTANATLDVFNLEGQKQVREAFSVDEDAYLVTAGVLDPIRTMTNADATYVLSQTVEVATLDTPKEWDKSTSPAYSEASEQYSIRDDRWLWNVSDNGVGEYYLTRADGTDPRVITKGAYTDNVAYFQRIGLTPGTVGSLSAGEFALDDNETVPLGYTTIYVRLATSSDPELLDERDITYTFHWTKNPANFKKLGFTDLPDNDEDNDFAKAGKVLFLKFDEPGFPSGYYGGLNTDDPNWTRLRARATKSELDPKTMPLRVFSEAPTGGDPRSTFTTKEQVLEPRRSGDNLTNLIPSFVGETLSDITSAQGSFFLAHGETWVKSQTAAKASWFLDNFANVTSRDRIDFDLGVGKVTLIDYLIPFQNSIVVFTKGNQQFQIISSGDGEVLTPQTANSVPSTAYSSLPNVRPVAMDFVLFFAAEKLGQTQILEYKFENRRATNIAQDITAHVHGYIPEGLDGLSVSSNHKMLITHTTTDPNSLFVYKTHWVDELTKVQEAWGRWTLASDMVIKSFNIVGDYVYVVVLRNNQLFLEKIALDAEANFPGMESEVLLDGKQEVATSNLSYDSGTDLTTISLGVIDQYVDNVLLSGDWVSTKVGKRLPVLSNTSPGAETILTVLGDYTANSLWVGRGYASDFVPSRQYIRDEEGDGILEGHLKLVRLLISYQDSAYFKVENRLQGRGTVTSEYNPRVLGDSSQPWGQVIFGNGEPFRVPIQTDAKTADIHIINDSPYPHRITDIEFHGLFIPETRR